ncbi:ribosome biogenesis GTPase Der [Candidatus Profftella armatura (Diaphorina cf. continua)]|uniref:GTPase Der n=1 Tax=Candidatus Profftella armatura (Diaphorina cf. continua) TaxID=2661583 RepID=A0A7R6VYL7_9PROT|nr:ribosome biogenesis GTPase Der [Candidatus Profftella armatura (Diaphorina cf. continua)]BCG49507.1 ribosome biogenesis GTPase Der [Candidatus Profftella armatura (Diaphorina cf. continua)]
MKPVLVLVGRPNVGKSTLFNRLTNSRNALVANHPGSTRDRHYGEVNIGKKSFIIIDTGGFDPEVKKGIMYEMTKQTKQAIIESDIIIFIVDGRQGLVAQDKIITNFLRKSGQPIVLVINKSENINSSMMSSDFYELGISNTHIISALYGNGIKNFIENILNIKLTYKNFSKKKEFININSIKYIKVAIVGKPNVGKSTLINTLLGEKRVITYDIPGTTRDSIRSLFEYNNQKYILIDTAGIRRRGKIFEVIEKFSVIKTLKSILEANVVILLLDAQQNISEQDVNIAHFIYESGRALIVCVNKWDSIIHNQREIIKNNIKRKLNFLSFAIFNFISAIKLHNINSFMKSINHVYDAAIINLSTPRVTRALINAIKKHPPCRKKIIRPKLRYAHQGGKNPPIIVIHGNRLKYIGNDYKRYLEKYFCKTFSLVGTPLKIEFRSNINPYIKK